MCRRFCIALSTKVFSIKFNMPTNDSFTFEVLLGGLPVREYVKDGKTYIMTDLMHPTTYYEDLVDVIDGEQEKQKVPVTPYTISILLTAKGYKNAIAVIYVDGVVVNSLVVRNEEKSVVKGFEDGRKTREFLFSLPRFGLDKEDRIEKKRLSEVGVIEVVLKEAKYKKQILRQDDQKRAKLDYIQATKKDAIEVTDGKHTMATSKPGRVVDSDKPTSKKRKFNASEMVGIYGHGPEFTRQKCMYHMKHTLAEMGIDL